MRRWSAPAGLTAAVAYLCVLGFGMQRWSYDVWGALVMAPVLAALGVFLLRHTFRGELRELLPYAYAGLAAKAAGSLTRYWVAFDAYGGNADAGRYHAFGKTLAGQIRSGEVSVLETIPSGTGTEFMERLTATLYTFAGSSRLAGFLLFGFMGYWGAVFYLRAAIVAVPGLARRRYAAMLFFLPSIVFWPSSIGKEAWMMLCLGLATWGGALALSGGRSVRALTYAALGLTGAALVRPHLGGMWLAAIALALVAGLLTRRTDGRQRSKGATVMLLGVSLVALVFVAILAIRYLEPGDENDAAPVTDRVTSIFEETERRSEQGGSGFETITLGGPQTWPVAIVRTLTRPLPHEATSLATLLPAAEMSVLLLLAMVGWRRFVNVPLLMRTTPYLVFVVALLVMWGLAYVSIGNLGILTRQRSLALPVMAVLWCVSPWTAKRTPADLAPLQARHFADR